MRDFYSHAPRGARQNQLIDLAIRRISTHTPLAGRDLIFMIAEHYQVISTHTPLAGRDMAPPTPIEIPVVTFLLTRPSRGATIYICTANRTAGISTHTPLAGRDNPQISLQPLNYISTHTPLAGRDLQALFANGCKVKISTHTPLAGRDALYFVIVEHVKPFLLTRPSRGATNALQVTAAGGNFYSHAPRGARHQDSGHT